jgi:general secretion pathway protein E
MVLSQELKDMISHSADLNAIRRQAIKEGMRTLRLSGAHKVGAGMTTPEEVLRVAPATPGVS